MLSLVAVLERLWNLRLPVASLVLGGLLPGDEARGVCEVVEGLVLGLSLSSGVCSL